MFQHVLQRTENHLWYDNTKSWKDNPS